jgi:hypothetical protein
VVRPRKYGEVTAMYIGGGLITLIVIVLVLFFIFRR